MLFPNLPSLLLSIFFILFPIFFLLNFSLSQNFGFCNPCFDGICPNGFSCIGNNCCVISSSSTSSSSSASSTSTVSPSQSCKDTVPSNLCNFYRITGKCLQRGFIVWLMAYCKSTCGLCTARIVPIG